MLRSKYVSATIAVTALLLGGLTYWSRNVPPDLAPFVPTPMVIVDAMLRMAKVQPDDVVYDLGCGDGRIVISAARRYGARGVGVEYDPQVAQIAIDNVRRENLEDRVDIVVGDATKIDVSGASIVALYLLPEGNRKLRPILERSLVPGSRVVSHDFEMPGWKAVQVEHLTDGTGRVHTVYVYEMGSHR